MSARLLSLRQLAERWGWSVDRVYRLVQKGQLPYLRIGRDFFFREADIDAWLDAQTVRPKEVAPAPAAKAGRRSDVEWAADFGLEPDELLQ